MKYLAMILTLLAPALARAEYLPGDLIFQTSGSSQAAAIMFGTDSPYSHMGMILAREDGSLGVIEAVGPVQIVGLDDWIARGDQDAYTVLRDPRLEDYEIRELIRAAKTYLGRPYDPFFQMGATHIYCSELIGLAYAQALHQPIGRVQQVQDLNVTHPAAQALIRARWWQYPGCENDDFESCQSKIMQSPILTPASIANDASLVQISTTY